MNFKTFGNALVFIGIIVLDIVLIWATIQHASMISLAILVGLGGRFIFCTILFGFMALMLSIFLISISLEGVRR